MKSLFSLFLALLLITGCQKESDFWSLEDTDDISIDGDEHYKKALKIEICHYDDKEEDWKIIRVSSKSWHAHEKHGDIRLDDADGDGFVPYNECGFGNMGDCDDNDPNINIGAVEICGNGVDEDCDGIDEECERVFAIAYSNLNGVDGFQEGEDILISKLIDFNNDGVLSKGDKIITDRYPENIEMSQIGEFSVKEHVVEGIDLANSYYILLVSPETLFHWEISPYNGQDQYFEDGQSSKTDFRDRLEGQDWINIYEDSPSKPERNWGDTGSTLEFGDDPFIDVDIFIN